LGRGQIRKEINEKMSLLWREAQVEKDSQVLPILRRRASIKCGMDQLLNFFMKYTIIPLNDHTIENKKGDGPSTRED
jgi:hypothetical protein